MNSDIKFYWGLIRRRLPVMAVIVMICTGIGVALAMTMPPKYEASAQLLVEGAELPTDIIESTVQTGAALALQGIQLRLMSRENLIDIASKHRVFAGETGMSPDDIVQAILQAIPAAGE